MYSVLVIDGLIDTLTRGILVDTEGAAGGP